MRYQKQSFDGTESLTYQHDDEQQFDPVWGLYPNEKRCFTPLFGGASLSVASFTDEPQEVVQFEGNPPMDVVDCVAEVRNARWKHMGRPDIRASAKITIHVDPA